MKSAVGVRSRLRRIGKAPLCNDCAERAPRLGGFVYVLCYRCTGLITGYAVGFLVRSLSAAEWRPEPALIALALAALPLDALAQRYTRYRSTSMRRALTGLAFGAALAFT